MQYRFSVFSDILLFFAQIGNQGQVHKDVNHTQVMCMALDGIECAGTREFLRGNEPCIKYEIRPIGLHRNKRLTLEQFARFIKKINKSVYHRLEVM